MRVEFYAEARRELRAAAVLYQDLSPGLGRDLLSEVRRATERIRALPRSGSPDSSNRRVVRLRRFPFKIVYREFPDAIVVVAVAHERRRSGYWRGRG